MFGEVKRPAGSGRSKFLDRSALDGIRHEMSICACLEDHVSTLPWFVIDQTPFMACAGVIHSQKNITWMDRERLATHHGKFEDARQRNDILRYRIIVPVKR